MSYTNVLANYKAENVETLITAYKEGYARNLGELSIQLKAAAESSDYSSQDLQDALEALTPELQINAFLGVMSMYADQRFFSLNRGGWEYPFEGMFIRDANSFGEFYKYQTLNIDPERYPKFSYDADDLTFGTNVWIKPDVREVSFKIEDAPQFTLTVDSDEVWKCFIGERPFGGYVAELFRTIESLKKHYMYNLNKSLLNQFKKKYVVVKGTDEASLLEEVGDLKMLDKLARIPGKARRYNEDGAYVLGINEPTLLIDMWKVNQIATKLDAKIYGPEYVKLPDVRKIDNLPMSEFGVDVETSGRIGSYFDGFKPVVIIPLNKTRATVVNARNGRYNVWLTMFVEAGIIPQLTGVDIIEGKVSEPVIKVANDSASFVLESEDANTEIYYTLDGSSVLDADGKPTANAVLYEAEFDQATNPTGVVKASAALKGVEITAPLTIKAQARHVGSHGTIIVSTVDSESVA